jgi:AraC-like protein
MRWDTSRVPARERVDAIAGLVGELDIRCTLHHERNDTSVHARLEAAALGAVSAFTYSGSGLRMVQSRRKARSAPEVVAVAVQGRRPGGLAQHGDQRLLRPGELFLIDHTSTYDYRWHGDGGAASIDVPLDVLGLPVELVRRAGRQPAASPLRDLVKNHVRRVNADLTRLAADPGAAALGRATLDLVRALVLTAASTGPADDDTAAVLRTRRRS